MDNKPFYSYSDKCWKVNIDGVIVEGDINLCLCEYIHDNLFYKLGDGDHSHSFDGVLEKIVACYQIDNIEGEREQYSEQELRIINKLKGMLREE